MRRTTTHQSTHANQFFVTDVTDFDGEKRSIISSQPFSDRSIHITAKRDLLDKNKNVIKKQTVSGALFLMIIHCSHQQGIFLKNKKKLPYDAWTNIFLFIFNIQHFEQVEHIACYAAALKIPSFFKRNSMSSLLLLDAVMRGQEDMVMSILQNNPEYLLKKAIVKNSVGVEYEVTLLQAAIMANDIQMVESMQEHFSLLTRDLEGKPIDGIAEMHRQIKEIYQMSLQKYLSLQKIKIAALEASHESGQNMGHLIGRAQRHYNVYWEALQCDDINQIINAHNFAQENNAFDFSPYIDAILNAPQAELGDVMMLVTAKTAEEVKVAIIRTGVAAREADECRGKPFAQVTLTLVQKLNRFREKFVEHVQKEIIFNPNHILSGFRNNETIWETLRVDGDPDFYKRITILSQLAGWTQRHASEPVRQDIRQSIFYLTQNESRTRQSRFNVVDANWCIIRNAVVDISLVDSTVVDGLGYKIEQQRARTGAHPNPNMSLLGVVPTIAYLALDFKRYVEQKRQAFSKLLAPREQSRHSVCVVQ